MGKYRKLSAVHKKTYEVRDNKFSIHRGLSTLLKTYASYCVTLRLVTSVEVCNSCRIWKSRNGSRLKNGQQFWNTSVGPFLCRNRVLKITVLLVGWIFWLREKFYLLTCHVNFIGLVPVTSKKGNDFIPNLFHGLKFGLRSSSYLTKFQLVFEPFSWTSMRSEPSSLDNIACGYFWNDEERRNAMQVIHNLFNWVLIWFRKWSMQYLVSQSIKSVLCISLIRLSTLPLLICNSRPL